MEESWAPSSCLTDGTSITNSCVPVSLGGSGAMRRETGSWNVWRRAPEANVPVSGGTRIRRRHGRFVTPRAGQDGEFAHPPPLVVSRSLNGISPHRTHPTRQHEPLRQQRKWRIWRVERGQRPQPRRFSSLPGVSRFETEKSSKPQVMPNVGLTAARKKYDFVKVN